MKNNKGASLITSIFVFISSVIILLILIFFVAEYAHGQFYKSGSNQEPVSFMVEQGQDAKEIGANLQKQGIIKSTFWFNIYMRMHPDLQTIDAGLYQIPSSSSIAEAVADLHSPENQQQSIRIEEGSTINDIAKYLAANTSISAIDFISAEQAEASTYDYFGQTPKPATLEGYLFPDTYYINAKNTPDELISKMLADTGNKIAPQMIAQAQAQNMTIQQVITVASLIEKEIGGTTARDPAVVQKERATVAGIIYNRLQAGMALQLDSSGNYVQPGAKSPDSAYNTYNNKGLPPGPVCNPSLDSIEAALNPLKSNYLYFITAPDGTAYFASTLQQQNVNIAKYLGK